MAKIELTRKEHRMLQRALLRSVRRIDPGMLAVAKQVVDRIDARGPLTEEQIIAGGVLFVMEDGS